MLLHVGMLSVSSYLVFVFASNLFNPFVVVHGPLKRRQLKVGRASALATLAAGIIAVFAIHLFGLNERVGLILYLTLALAFAAPSLVRYHRSAIWR